MWRLRKRKHSEARRCDPVPRMRVSQTLQEAHSKNCAI